MNSTLPPVFDVMPGVRRPTETAPFAELHAPRVRTLLPRGLGGEWPGPSNIGLIVPKHLRQNAMSLGAERDGFFRFFVRRSEAVDPKFQPYLPLIGRKHLAPLCVDMIPTSSFGASLKNLLTDDCWRLIRREAYQSTGGVCICCGEGTGPLECHEAWDFDDDRNPDGWHTQSLKHLLPVCRPCHLMFHPGLANLHGLADEVQDRVQKINIWTPADYELDGGYANRMHAIRSRKRWVLDFSSVALPTLEISDRWERSRGSETLSLVLSTGRCTTRVVGAAYRHRGENYGADRTPAP